MSDSRLYATSIVLVMVVFGWIAISTAWLSDDSFISFRQVFNVINGYGYTFNFDQRVQSFTHPTWVLLLTLIALVTREFYLTTLVLSVTLSLSSILFIFKHSGYLPGVQRTNAWFALCFALSLAFSKSFTDYMTSGLENPLSYVLVGWTVSLAAKSEKSELSRGAQSVLFVILALALLTRFDHAILLLPVALYVAYFRIGVPAVFKVAIPGTLVILGWFTFAIVYFGTPLPNSYFAKVSTGYPSHEVYERGWRYLSIGFERDSVTFVLLLLGTSAGLIVGKGIYRALSVGSVLYGVWVVSVGGDFMLGRFLAVPAYLSMFNLCALPAYVRPLSVSVATAGVIVGVIGMTIGSAPLWSGPGYSNAVMVAPGIADERGWYYQMYGLLAPKRRWPRIKRPVSEPPVSYRVACGMGILGLQHPDVYLIDRCGLTDAFLSRMPAVRHKDWRIGHHYRKVPTNYGLHLTGTGTLQDERLKPMLNDVEEAIRGALFTESRWRAIWRLNVTRPYDFDMDTYTDPRIAVNLTHQTVERRLSDLNYRDKVADGTPWNASGNAQFDHQLIVQSQSDALIKGIQLSLDSNDRYEIIVNGTEKFMADAKVSVMSSATNGGMVSHDITFQRPIVVRTVLIEAVRGDGFYALGHLILVEGDAEEDGEP